MANKIILETKNLGINFLGLNALEDFSISVNGGEILGLIGPNGAGKTTVINLLTNVYIPTSGNIYYNQKSTLGLKPYQLHNIGISRTFQNIRLFKNMSAIDNVKMGLHDSYKYNALHAILRTKKYFAKEKCINDMALKMLQSLNLETFANSRACNLPYGTQRLLEIARALINSPQVLLLDEPAAGMNPSETAKLMQDIKMLRDRYNLTIILIDHDMKLIMGVCERIVMLNYGKIIAIGTPNEIKTNPEVISAYLGRGTNEHDGQSCGDLLC